MVEDVEKGMVVDGTLVRLRDIGDTSQGGTGQVHGGEGKNIAGRVMELSDNRTSILSP
jgi:hypothetical protein